RGLDRVLRELREPGGSDPAFRFDPLAPTIVPGRDPDGGSASPGGVAESQARDTGEQDKAGSIKGTADRLTPPAAHPTWPDFFRWAAELGIQAAEGIAYAHQRGVIHRDIKPSNLILDSQGVLWITDFGLARRIDDPELTKSGSLLGTPRYMSPEQAAAAKNPVDHRTDIYSLGASLYELLACRPAFEGATPMEVVVQILDREPIAPRRLNPAVPRDLETIVLKAMSKRACDRYQSGAELADDLRRWQNVEPIRARPIGPIGRLVRWCRRNPAVAALTIAVAALLVTIAVTSSVAALRLNHLAQRERDAAERADTARRRAEESQQSAEEAHKQADLERIDANRQRQFAVDAREQEQTAREQAETERNRAVASEEQARDHLIRSLYEQAHALTKTQVTGRRWQALDRLREAETLRSRHDEAAHTVRPGGTTIVPTQAELRSAAVAAALLVDGRMRRRSELGLLGIHAPAVSVDGRWLAVLWIDPVRQKSGVRLVDLSNDGEPRRIEFADQIAFASLALNADGSLLATGTPSGVTLWKLPSGERVRVLEWPRAGGDPPPPQARFFAPGGISIRFSPDGARLAVVRPTFHPDARDKQTIVWNLANADEPQVLSRGNLIDVAPSFSSDGKRLAFPAGEKNLAVWNCEKAEKSADVMQIQARGQTAFALDGEVLAIGPVMDGTDQGTLLLWNLRTGTELKRLAAGADFFGSAMAVSPDGRKLAVGTLSGGITIFSLPDGDRILRLDGGHVTLINSVSWIDSGRGLVSVGMDGSLRTWEMDFDVARTMTATGEGNPSGIAYSPDGKWLAVASTRPGGARFVDSKFQIENPPPTKLIDRATGRVVRDLPGVGLPTTLVFRSDSRQLASGTGQTAVAWDVETGAEVARAESTSESILTSCGFGPAGQFLVGRRHDKRPAVVDVAADRLLWQPPADVALTDGVVSGGGRYYFGVPPMIGAAKNYQLWDLPGGARIAEFERIGATELGAPEISGNGRWLAIGYLDMEVSAVLRAVEPGQARPMEYGVAVWSLPAGRKHLNLPGPLKPTRYAISRDGRYLAIGYLEGTVHLWDLTESKKIFEWNPSSRSVSQLAFSPDGDVLAAADGQSHAIELLDLAKLRKQLDEAGLSW
ncbi:MAG: protein kinase, partial [Planctomycetia bacterium]|nr:protein kinase [Planctomycetia bacterium]